MPFSFAPASGVQLAPNGAQAAPSYAFATSPSSGVYWDGTNIDFATAGTRRALVGANGLGMLSPLYFVVDNNQDIGKTGERPRNILLAGYEEFGEIADPAAPATNFGRLYVRDNGSGKSQLCVRFPTGVVQVVASEP